MSIDRKFVSGDAGLLVRVRPHQQLAHANHVPDSVYLLLSGWVMRYRILADGRRQITSYYLPGDICGLYWLHGDNAGQPVQAVNEVKAVQLRCADVLAAAQANPAYLDRLTHEVALDASIQAEHHVTLGRRTAAERLAQLFCEIHCRMDAAGLAQGGECSMPFTQMDIADLCGLTAIHVNRVLQELRGAEMIELKARRLKLIDPERLARLAMFDPRYLSGLAGLRLRDGIDIHEESGQSSSTARTLEQQRHHGIDNHRNRIGIGEAGNRSQGSGIDQSA
jgi:CRP-like cAMP-binding protein